MPITTTKSPFDWPLRNANEAQAMVEAVQTQARRQGHRLRPAPTPPTTCCGRGCNGCVWEGYFAALLYWRDEAQAALRTRPTTPAPRLTVNPPTQAPESCV